MVYSTNQNRQFYVAKAYKSGVANISATGDIYCNCADGELYFVYQGADPVPMRSDRIPCKNLDYVKASTPLDMARPLRQLKVTLDANVNEGKPVAGQDYILRIAFRQFYGMSDEDQYFKDIAVHATAADTTAEAFFTKVVNAANLAFSREIGATKTSNPYLKFTKGGSGNSAYLTIQEKPQEYVTGTMAQEQVYFEVIPTTIYTGGEDVIWGVVEDTTPQKYVEDTDDQSDTYGELIPNEDLEAGADYLINGPQIADLEYFCMGERGDQYRMIGWPNHIPTKYLVDPTKEYYVLDLHFAFTDTGVNSYRSEKDITIVSTTAAPLNSIIGVINSATGLSIATL